MSHIIPTHKHMLIREIRLINNYRTLCKMGSLQRVERIAISEIKQEKFIKTNMCFGQSLFLFKKIEKQRCET